MTCWHEGSCGSSIITVRLIYRALFKILKDAVLTNEVKKKQRNERTWWSFLVDTLVYKKLQCHRCELLPKLSVWKYSQRCLVTQTGNSQQHVEPQAWMMDDYLKIIFLFLMFIKVFKRFQRIVLSVCILWMQTFKTAATLPSVHVCSINAHHTHRCF